MRLNIAQWDGSGEPILLLHGMAANTHWWDQTAPFLSEHFQPYALDFHGHGDSAWLDDGAYSTKLFIEDIETARKTLGLERMALCAHSLGARLALGYANTHPERISALIAVDFVPELPQLSGSRQFGKFRNIKQPYLSDPQILIKRFHLEPPGTLLTAAQLSALAGHCVKKTETGWTWKFDWRLFRYHYEPIWPFLPKIKVPTLIVRGQGSAVMGREDLKKVVDSINASGGRWAQDLEIEGAFHHLPLDVPERLALEIVKFASNHK